MGVMPFRPEGAGYSSCSPKKSNQKKRAWVRRGKSGTDLPFGSELSLIFLPLRCSAALTGIEIVGAGALRIADIGLSGELDRLTREGVIAVDGMKAGC